MDSRKNNQLNTHWDHMTYYQLSNKKELLKSVNLLKNYEVTIIKNNYIFDIHV